MANRRFEIVVAHYNEDLKWLNPVSEDCTIYSKGDIPTTSKPFKFLPLPNIGREGHTYLQHIISCYHDLADVVLFVQGHIEDHVALSIEQIRDICLNHNKREIITFPSADTVSSELVCFDEWTGIQWSSHPCLAKWASMEMRHAAQTPATYFAQFFGKGRIPLSVGYVSGAVFAVPRELIHNLSKDFYQDLLNSMFLGSMEHVNPETGFLMERFWLAMWQPDKYICWGEDEISLTERDPGGQLSKGRWRPLPGLASKPRGIAWRDSSKVVSLPAL